MEIVIRRAEKKDCVRILELILELAVFEKAPQEVTLLFDQLIIEAKERKLYGICWQVLDWNETAINFYKKYNASFDGEWINCSIS